MVNGVVGFAGLSVTLATLEAGKRLELGCLTGAIIEIAHRLGVPVPRSEAVHACALAAERTRDRAAAG